MEEEKKELMPKAKEEVEKIIKTITENGLQVGNVDLLYKLVDIHKDIEKEEIMRYRDDSYGRRGVKGTGLYSRYRESYNARGVSGTGRGRYRGEEMLDEMAYHYGNYSDGMSNYGADNETMKSFQYMLKSFKDYYKHLKNEASSQEEVQMLEETAQEMLDM